MRGGWMKLGEICIRAGLASQEVIDYLLSLQERSGQHLGDLLTAAGLLSPAQVAELLQWQNRYRQGEALPVLVRPVYRAVWASN